MKHLGDITKLSGCVVPAVDVVIGGSPCQGLSVAGKQAGLKDERSGLFMEQIRLVKEMRKADAAPSIIIKRTETQTSRLCVFSLLQPHRTEVRLTGKYRYLTFEDRKKIEAWHLLGDRPVDIAARLSVHHTTIYKELQRGATGALDANQREGYSAELAERRLRESFKRRGKRAPAAQ